MSQALNRPGAGKPFRIFQMGNDQDPDLNKRRDSGRNGPLNLYLVIGVILFSLVPNIIFAQDGSLIGVVINDSDSEPLFGAGVALKGENLSRKIPGAITDQKGSYHISLIPPGEYSVSISLAGFEVFDTSGVKVDRGRITTLDARLIHSRVTLNTVLVSASRRPEKILEAPASVSVVESEDIDNRTVLTPSDHIKGQPAVDIVSTGLNQSNVVVRGFNNIFSGVLLVLADNRIAQVPSLRYNAYNFIPVTDMDIERIEIVSGPGSALYGPNSASGIFHIITKSPFNSKGTTVSLGGGGRNILVGSLRHAGSLKNRVGYKISGEYYRGDDWRSSDSYEPDSIRFFKPTTTGPEYVGGWRKNNRDYKLEKASAEARADFIVTPDLYLIVDGGFNRADEIELTSLGASQAIGWTYLFAQMRLLYKNLFIPGYVHASDAGKTYLLRTGQLIIDKSKFWSAQIQHHFVPGEKISFVYGLDVLLTRPNTESTINGRNEANDNVDEYGAYLQSDVRISDHLKLTGAGRIDKHNRIEGTIISPRAAIAFQPNQNQNFRLTYNRAYSTPENANLFLDILQAKDPFGIGSGFEPMLGFRPDIDVRAQGVPESGFHWRFDASGPQFRSSFAPLDPRGIGPSDFIDFNDSVFTDVMWGVGREAVISGFASILAGFGIPQGTIDTLTGSMRAMTPVTLSGVNNVLRIYNPDTRSFDPVEMGDISDINPLEPTFTKTTEFGYKGMLGDRLQLGADIYRTDKNNFVGPLAIETPNVFLDQATLSDYLSGEFTDLLADPANAEYAAILNGLDDPSLGGNGNGTPVDELTNMYAYGTTQIPFGTVSPQEAYDPNAVLVTFRNFGNITLYGADIALLFRINSGLSFGGTYSYVSKNLVRKSSGQLHDIFLNSPKHKFSLNLQYESPRSGLYLGARLRFVDSFAMYGPFIGSEVSSYAVVDLNATLGFFYESKLNLTIQNVFDYRHAEFVGAPRLGRLMLLRLTRSF